MEWLILAALVAIAVVATWLTEILREARQYRELKPRLDRLDYAERELAAREVAWTAKVDADINAIQHLSTEKSTGFPWLAEAYADYFYLNDLKEAEHLERKKHPAHKSADKVREIALKRRKAEKLQRVLKYQLDYLERLFPWLEEFRQEDIDDLLIQITASDSEPAGDSDEDPASQWLSAAEYKSLPSVQKYQLALDRYFAKQKSSWEIGRDYERYVGYLYEVEGCWVAYYGITEGMADLGRDLLVTFPNGAVEIVQCKYWSAHKQIHEKHIFQLYGTVVAHRIDKPSLNITGVFYTSTGLSDRAKQFASALGIEYHEHKPLQPYPVIKCNVSDRGKIYHLPFDQQYDRTLIREPEERYVSTVAEAEALGFRRAYRWRGGKEGGILADR